MRAHLMSNTEKIYRCVNCGGQGNIIREGPDPRLKCNVCNFMYDASQSSAAEEAGLIPDGVPKVHDQIEEEEIKLKVDRNPREVRKASPAKPESKTVQSMPKAVKYLVVDKERYGYDFCTQRDLKKTLLKWEAADRKYDVFELQPKKVTAKVTIE